MLSLVSVKCTGSAVRYELHPTTRDKMARRTFVVCEMCRRRALRKQCFLSLMNFCGWQRQWKRQKRREGRSNEEEGSRAANALPFHTRTVTWQPDGTRRAVPVSLVQVDVDAFEGGKRNGHKDLRTERTVAKAGRGGADA